MVIPCLEEDSGSEASSETKLCAAVINSGAGIPTLDSSCRVYRTSNALYYFSRGPICIARAENALAV